MGLRRDVDMNFSGSFWEQRRLVYPEQVDPQQVYCTDGGPHYLWSFPSSMPDFILRARKRQVAYCLHRLHHPRWPELGGGYRLAPNSKIARSSNINPHFAKQIRMINIRTEGWQWDKPAFTQRETRPAKWAPIVPLGFCPRSRPVVCLVIKSGTV